jgi:hypothetical protein
MEGMGQISFAMTMEIIRAPMTEAEKWMDFQSHDALTCRGARSGRDR